MATIDTPFEVINPNDLDTASGEKISVVFDPTTGEEGKRITVKMKTDAIIAPTVNNDNTEGYSINSEWCDTVLKITYICVDASTGAAVWKNITTTADSQKVAISVLDIVPDYLEGKALAGANVNIIKSGAAADEKLTFSTGISSAKSADYTILDDDTIGTVLMTTGSSTDKTVTLPTAADNADRVIILIKADAGTNSLIVDGEGAETINGTLVFTIFEQYTGIKIKCDGDGTQWFILEIIGTIETNDTDNLIRTEATPILGTWYQPGGSNFSITIEPGTYELNCSYTIGGSISVTGQVILQTQLDSDISAPFGSGLIDVPKSGGLLLVGGKVIDYMGITIYTQRVTFSVATTIRPSVKYLSISGSPTLGALYIRGDNEIGRLTAKRIG